MKTLLWLDDYRNPFLDEEGKVPKGYDEIYWIQYYEEFVECIEMMGLPDAISFNHDLGGEKTGYDCAKWLVDYCTEKDLPLPRCYVHSDNPVGADNIKSHINNFIKHRAAEELL